MTVGNPMNDESNNIENHGEVLSPQGANKWVAYNQRGNYKGRVLEDIESEKKHAKNHPWRTTMHRCIGIRNS